MEDLNPIPHRITVVENVYHQGIHEQPFHAESKYSRELDSDEQVYERKNLKATTDWKLIETGWLDSNVSMLLVTNEEGKFLSRIPSLEQRVDSDKRILEVSFRGSPGSWLIPPGESIRGCPDNIRLLFIRCQYETAKYTIRLFPK